jgi:ferric-dicitrate binding protein FerR (iron transport regulator)
MKNYEQYIEKYLRGTLQGDEAEHLQKWLLERDENQELFDTYKEQWSPFSYSDTTVDQALRDTRRKVFKAGRIRKLVLQMASHAAILVVALMAYYIYNVTSQVEEQQQFCEVIAPRGEKSIVVLPDGSSVHLNSESRITYNTDFENKREVSLEGEAFFEVTHHEALTFKVQTANYSVVVHGTRFNVSAYENEKTQTTLFEGSVSLQNGEKEILLQPGEMATFQDGSFSVGKADLDGVNAWTDKRFVFNSIRFEELIKKLERWYDVKINIEDQELNDIIYSGTFKNEETIWQVLDVLSISENISYERTGFRTFKIKR